MLVILHHHIFPHWPGVILTLNTSATCQPAVLSQQIILIAYNEAVTAVYIYDEATCCVDIKDNQPRPGVAIRWEDNMYSGP